MSRQANLLDKLQTRARVVANRLSDQHVKLAVTGLSGAGKTAFITSLINQLMEGASTSSLPFFSVCKQSRFIGAKRAVQPDLRLARFEYEQAMEMLRGNPPAWPVPTRGVSQIRLHLRYYPGSGLRKLVSNRSTLILDILDYPGEWLLDLPLLDMNFAQWTLYCQQQMQGSIRQELSRTLREQASKLDWLAPGDELQLQKLAECFRQYLRDCKEAGLELIQPGRFVLPGELEGAPILQFIPALGLPGGFDWQQVPKGSNLSLAMDRYNQYRDKVIKPFYRAYFRDFDRQIVLVDCLSALNKGPEAFNELQQAINWILQSFHYGGNSLIRRLFSPRIDKLVFAASKADHITADQQDNLIRLLESMIHEARQTIHYEGVSIQTTALAAIRASQSGKADYQGKTLSVLTGHDKQGQPLTLYPGDVPVGRPSPAFWSTQGFDFPQFAPQSSTELSALPHIRMDQMLEFLLGDKLR